MALEIEIKARIKDPLQIEKNIQKLGGSFKKEVDEDDIYLNHPERDFEKTDEALRLRRTEGRVFLTYKGPKLDNLTKTREEINLAVEDLEKAREIFKNLGFTEVLPVSKKRRYYSLPPYEIMIDHVEGLGPYMEVEKRGEYDPEELFEFLADLGVSREDTETRSYLELKLEKI